MWPPEIVASSLLEFDLLNKVAICYSYNITFIINSVLPSGGVALCIVILVRGDFAFNLHLNYSTRKFK